jgi:hypothetical protein
MAPEPERGGGQRGGLVEAFELVADQLRGAHAEAGGQRGHHVGGRGAAAGLEEADVAGIDDALGELGLRQARGAAAFAQPLGQARRACAGLGARPWCRHVGLPFFRLARVNHGLPRGPWPDKATDIESR